MSKLNRIPVGIDNVTGERVKEMSGQDLLWLIKVLAKKFSGELDMDSLDATAVDSACKALEHVADSTDNAIDQLVASAMAALNMMANVVGMMEWVTGLIEIDNLTGDDDETCDRRK